MVEREQQSKDDSMEYLKPKILAAVDNTSWCWTKTVEDLAYHLPDYQIDIITANEFKKKKDFTGYDGIYLRGYANLFIKTNDINSIPPFVSTLSTGGNNLKMRLDQMEQIAKHGVGVIVQNKTAYHSCIAYGYENVWLIPNGVNTRIYYPAEVKPEKFLVGCAANTKDERAMLKGTPFIVDACNHLNVEYVETNKDTQLTYEQMAPWYQGLSIYAQPSDSEGCSNSVQEAMACGLPCLICENVGYHGEVCSCGLLHDKGEVIFVKRDANDIAEKINILMNDKETYERISNNARSFAINHDWKYMANRFRPVFNKLYQKSLEITPVRIIKEEHEKQIEEKNNTEENKTSYKFMEGLIEDNERLVRMLDKFVKNSNQKRSTSSILKALRIFGFLKEQD